MIVYSLLLSTFILAMFSIRMVWVSAARGWGSIVLLTGLSLSMFVYLYGSWVYGSVYLRYVFALSVIGILFFRGKSGVYIRERNTLRHKWFFVLVSAICLLLSVLYHTGTVLNYQGSIRLASPFRFGRYLVLQGGRGLPTNIMHASSRSTFVFAMDIVKLNAWGNRSSAIFSERLSDYAIFGDTVLSPCSGKVIYSIGENPDNIPPHARRGKYNTNGVVISTGQHYVCMVHMKYRGVFVKEGDAVVEGQPLGLAGNSGMSIEPHLHIQAHANTHTGMPWYREPPVEMLFEGKRYGLFDVINVHRK